MCNRIDLYRTSVIIVVRDQPVLSIFIIIQTAALSKPVFSQLFGRFKYFYRLAGLGMTESPLMGGFLLCVKQKTYIFLWAQKEISWDIKDLCGGCGYGICLANFLQKHFRCCYSREASCGLLLLLHQTHTII
uniref:Uncharacterized protein n=1 Tax=Micrurus surinamensis TaxID=129470 RepID=A0A2D4P500_MICSU